MTQGSFEPDGISLPAMRSPFRRIGIQTSHARPPEALKLASFMTNLAIFKLAIATQPSDFEQRGHDLNWRGGFITPAHVPLALPHVELAVADASERGADENLRPGRCRQRLLHQLVPAFVIQTLNPVPGE